MHLTTTYHLLSPPTAILTVTNFDSTVSILQLNVNGIVNQLTELGMIMDRHKVMVAVMQESKAHLLIQYILFSELHYSIRRPVSMPRRRLVEVSELYRSITVSRVGDI